MNIYAIKKMELQQKHEKEKEELEILIQKKRNALEKKQRKEEEELDMKMIQAIEEWEKGEQEEEPKDKKQNNISRGQK